MYQNPNIAYKIEKMLFAEDFMRFITYFENRGYYECFYEDFRPNVHVAFSESVRNAVRFLYAERGQFPIAYTIYGRRISELTLGIYIDFLNEMISTYFPTGFEINNFLTFCLRVTSMAAFFYKCNVFPAPVFAVQCIYDILENVDMFLGGWFVLQSIADSYAKQYAEKYNNKK